MKETRVTTDSHAGLEYAAYGGAASLSITMKVARTLPTEGSPPRGDGGLLRTTGKRPDVADSKKSTTAHCPHDL